MNQGSPVFELTILNSLGSCYVIHLGAVSSVPFHRFLARTDGILSCVRMSPFPHSVGFSDQTFCVSRSLVVK